ncbi:MAG TPA: hypothetical protein VHF22_08325, partial [Planctomycetota bacterium]|nr:hypothetical protein [Planctomycetota bacterium]
MTSGASGRAPLRLAFICADRHGSFPAGTRLGGFLRSLMSEALEASRDVEVTAIVHPSDPDPLPDLRARFGERLAVAPRGRMARSLARLHAAIVSFERRASAVRARTAEERALRVQSAKDEARAWLRRRLEAVRHRRSALSAAALAGAALLAPVAWAGVIAFQLVVEFVIP